MFPPSHILGDSGRYSNDCDWWCNNLKSFMTSFGNLEMKHQENYLRHLGAKNGTLVHSVSDVFYFPKRLALEIVEVLEKLEKGLVRSEVQCPCPFFYYLILTLSGLGFPPCLFVQIAIPTAFYAIESPSEYDPIAFQNVKYLWKRDRRSFREVFSVNISALHPWKLKSEELKEELLLYLADGDPTL